MTRKVVAVEMGKESFDLDINTQMSISRAE